MHSAYIFKKKNYKTKKKTFTNVSFILIIYLLSIHFSSEQFQYYHLKKNGNNIGIRKLKDAPKYDESESDR